MISPTQWRCLILQSILMELWNKNNKNNNNSHNSDHINQPERLKHENVNLTRSLIFGRIFTCFHLIT